MWEETKYLKKTHADIEKMCKLHAKRLQPAARFEPNNPQYYQTTGSHNTASGGRCMYKTVTCLKIKKDFSF